MALDTPPLLWRKRQLAFKLQTTTGTPASLSGTDAVTRVYDPEMLFDDNVIDQENEGTLSPRVQALGARGGSLTFETDAVGNGSSGLPSWADLLKACGCTAGSGQVFSPLDGATDILTFGQYQDGLLKYLTDAMGSFVMSLKAGEKGRFRWNFMGVQGKPPEDEAILTPTKSTVVAPRVGATAFTVNGKVCRCDMLEFDAGNEVILREDLLGVDSASEATGYRSAFITNRRPIIRITPEARLVATEDLWDLQRDATTVAISIQWGSANNGFTLAAPAAQLIRQPRDANRKGMLAHQLEFLCTGSAGSEWSLTFN